MSITRSEQMKCLILILLKFLPIFSRFQSILPKINKEIDLENFPKIQKIIKLFLIVKIFVKVI